MCVLSFCVSLFVSFKLLGNKKMSFEGDKIIITMQDIPQIHAMWVSIIELFDLLMGGHEINI